MTKGTENELFHISDHRHSWKGGNVCLKDGCDETRGTTPTPVAEPVAPEAPPEPATPEPKNPVLEAPSLDGKLKATVTSYAKYETMLEKAAVATLQEMAKNSTDPETAIKNLGDFRCAVRIGEAASKTGRAARDGDTGGHFCGHGTKYGATLIGDMKGSEILINIWNLHGKTADEVGNIIFHETLHLWSYLIAADEKERDCNKAGGHRRYTANKDYSFEALVDQLGWLELVELDNYAKLTTNIGKEGKKMVKKLDITAIDMGKVAAKAPPKARRINLVCPNCELKVMVPTGKWDRGEIELHCYAPKNDGCYGTEMVDETTL